MSEQEPIIIYTDGSCLGNPGPGGWGVLLQWRGHEKTMHGNAPDTTNNRMELTAVIQALQSLKNNKHPIIVYTDSTYVKNGITEWLPKWKSKNFMAKGNKAIKNQDLWLALDALYQQYDVEFQWVKAHSDNALNNQVDVLARNAASELKK